MHFFQEFRPFLLQISHILSRMNSTESTAANSSATFDLSTSYPDPYAEVANTVLKILIPILFVLGNVGNITSFAILRTGELKTLSTCFYMSILAVVDTGK